MDKFGRPGHSWNKFSDNKVTTTVKYGPYIDTPLATYTVAAKKCDVIKDIGTDYAGTTFTTYTNGNAVEDKVKMTDTATESIGAQGRLTEVYDGTIVYVDTFLANVTKVIATKTDANGHTTDPETTIAVFDNTDTLPATLTYGTEAFKLGDFVLITAAKVKNSDKSKEVYEVASMVAATSKSGRLTTIKTGYTTDTADLQNIAGVDNAAAAVNVTGKYINTNDTINGAMAVVLGKTYSFFYDTYGNVIGAMNVAGNFCVIDELYREPVKGTSIVKGTLVKPDASKLSDVTITMIDNRQDVNNGSHGFGLLNVAQDLALGDLLYIQWTDKDNNDRMSNDEIVAVYDMYIDEGITVTPTTVKFTTSAPAYMNKTFPTITLTVGAKDTVVVKMNDKTLEAVTDYTYDAATGKITSPKLVTGPIVITVTPYAKSSDAKLVADNTNPARNCTLSVQEEVTPKTVTVTGQEGKTVTIADLKACLKTNNAGASYKIYDNTTKTEITDGTVSVNYVNMFVLVTAEDGTTAQYDIITSAG